jgi:hypothetical protein
MVSKLSDRMQYLKKMYKLQLRPSKLLLNKQKLSVYPNVLNVRIKETNHIVDLVVRKGKNVEHVLIKEISLNVINVV